MGVEQMNMVANILFGSAVFFFSLAVVIFFTCQIRKSWKMLLGNHEFSHMKTYVLLEMGSKKLSSSRLKRTEQITEVSAKIPRTCQPEPIESYDQTLPMMDASVTASVVTVNEANPEETMLLDVGHGVINREEETILLDTKNIIVDSVGNEEKTTVLERKEFVLIEDIMFIHTNIKI